jgi:hypothetical protein
VKKIEPPFKIEIEKIDVGDGRLIDMKKAVTKEGHFIGSLEDATALWKKFGITVFELRIPKCKVCSVGYSQKKKLWYGWSHRAIRGFKTRAAAAKFAERVS